MSANNNDNYDISKQALERSLARLDHVAQLLTAPDNPELYPWRDKVLRLADELYEFIEKYEKK